MINPSQDPKGYYSALGIEETANAETIKTAFRQKAKRLHPDFNTSPIAAKQFQRLHEAYEILGNPTKRETYDRSWTHKRKAKSDSPYSKKMDTKPKVVQTSGKSGGKQKSKAKPETKASDVLDQPVICECGQITAQPRYITFDLIWGRLTHTQHREISGIYCRSCADRAAIRASLITWISGWWAWPYGPKETVKALLSNMRGGRKPTERNAKLLIRQSRAFRARGEMELSRNAAEQALAFAATSTLRHDIDSLLLSLSTYPSRTLKNRWAKPGWAASAQIMPLACIVAFISLVTTVSAPTSLTDAVRNLFMQEHNTISTIRSTPVPKVNEDVVGRVFSLENETTNLRTGPGPSYKLIMVLDKGMVVLATELDPSGEWFRVVTVDGTTGFVNINQLNANLRVDSRKVLEIFVEKPPPAYDDIP